jgi:nucleoid-associated protein YgaU
MGLIDFVRSAGEKIFGAGDAAAAPTKDEAVLSKRANTLEDHVRGLGLPVEGLKIKVADDVAYVTGNVATQEVREKVILAVGNVQGIARVEDRLEVTNPQIFEANKPMLKHPDKIYPGQVLRIP